MSTFTAFLGDLSIFEWALIAVASWSVLAVAVGVGIGRAIKLADPGEDDDDRGPDTVEMPAVDPDADWLVWPGQEDVPTVPLTWGELDAFDAIVRRSAA